MMNILQISFEGLSDNMAWADILLNRIAVIVTAFVFFLELGLYPKFLSNFIYSFNTERTAISMDSNYSFSRLRDVVYLSFVLVFCIIVDRYNLYSNSILDKLGQQWHLLGVFAVFIIYLILRRLCSLIVLPRNINPQTREILKKTPRNFFIIIGAFYLVFSALSWYLKLDTQLVKLLLLISLVPLYLLSIIRTFKILRLSCNGISSFLYLCGLEFLPSAVLIFSTLF